MLVGWFRRAVCLPLCAGARFWRGATVVISAAPHQFRKFRQCFHPSHTLWLIELGKSMFNAGFCLAVGCNGSPLRWAFAKCLVEQSLRLRPVHQCCLPSVLNMAPIYIHHTCFGWSNRRTNLSAWPLVPEMASGATSAIVASQGKRGSVIHEKPGAMHGTTPISGRTSSCVVDVVGQKRWVPLPSGSRFLQLLAFFLYKQRMHHVDPVSLLQFWPLPARRLRFSGRCMEAGSRRTPAVPRGCFLWSVRAAGSSSFFCPDDLARLMRAHGCPRSPSIQPTAGQSPRRMDAPAIWKSDGLGAAHRAANTRHTRLMKTPMMLMNMAQ